MGQSFGTMPSLLVPIHGPGDLVLQTAQALLMLVGMGIFAMPVYQLFSWKPVNIPTTFKCPAVPLIPIVAMGANMYMMVNLNPDAWIRLVVWLFIGLIIYASYGRIHSKLAQHSGD
jgi:APA family basic amino acid/polyamine antiporter